MTKGSGLLAGSTNYYDSELRKNKYSRDLRKETRRVKEVIGFLVLISGITNYEWEKKKHIPEFPEKTTILQDLQVSKISYQVFPVIFGCMVFFSEIQQFSDFWNFPRRPPRRFEIFGIFG